MDISHLKMGESHEIVHVKLEQVKADETLEKVICSIILQLSCANIELIMNIMTIPLKSEDHAMLNETDSEQPKVTDLIAHPQSFSISTL